MARNIDQTNLTKEAGLKCLCVGCIKRTKCSFANSLWAAKTLTAKYGGTLISFITLKCDRREKELVKPVYTMSQLHEFFVKFGVDHLCDECPEKDACEFRYFAVAAHDVAETQKFNPWHIVHKCLNKKDPK